MADISKTRQLTPKQSRLINSSTSQRKNMCSIMDFGVNCPFKQQDAKTWCNLIQPIGTALHKTFWKWWLKILQMFTFLQIIPGYMCLRKILNATLLLQQESSSSTLGCYYFYLMNDLSATSTIDTIFYQCCIEIHFLKGVPNILLTPLCPSYPANSFDI